MGDLTPSKRLSRNKERRIKMTNQTMLHVLQGSSLHSLLLLTSKVLSRSGFGEVQVLDRRETRQKSRFGGHELMCESTFGSLPVKVIVKVINDSVRLRMLDELVGAVQRTKADLGIIVSPRHVTASARKLQDHYKASRVNIIDGTELADRLTRLGIGVRPKGDVDFQFFGALEEVGHRVTAFMKMGAR
ncbi:hypothetical protein CCB80_08730 [Armatimonadetes bacterium Uphvl-Ar1]|nr:hypothetical protein CCB80_08730 [Armatimonadetes bacterium Uphvl-Ar1]